MDAASCTGATARQLCHADGDCTTTGLTQCCPPTYGNDGRCSAPGSC
jgi:hypothetical protein